MITEDDIILCDYELLRPRAISEDTILRNGGPWPEYAYTLMLCVDRFEQGLAAGQLYSFCIQKPFSFNSLDQMLLGALGMLDEANLEQAWLKPHALKKRRKQVSCAVNEEPKRRKTAYPFDGLHVPKGKIANFYFRVYSRQHASIQGVLAQCERGAKPNTFRSALELIHMLYDALGETSIPKPKK